MSEAWVLRGPGEYPDATLDSLLGLAYDCGISEKTLPQLRAAIRGARINTEPLAALGIIPFQSGAWSPNTWVEPIRRL